MFGLVSVIADLPEGLLANATIESLSHRVVIISAFTQPANLCKTLFIVFVAFL
jgi:hypothetical protein